MKMNFTTKKDKLLSYSAMAAAFVACSSDANADIVYVDITDASLVLGDFATLDLDGDGVVDFGFILDSDTPDWTFVQAFGYLSALSYGNPNNQIAGYSGAFLPYASAIDSGAEIGAGLDFLTSTYNLAFIASLYSGVTYGQFGDGTDKFMGIQFDISGTLHYGWIRVNATVDPVTLTIKDWAYDDEADVPIIAGATATPIPLVSFASDAILVNETDAATTITVQLDIPGDASVDLDVNDALTTATNGADFTFSDPTSAIFSGGVTTVSFDVTLLDDIEFEGAETIVIDITNPIGCELGATIQYTIIINDDELPLPPFVNLDGSTVTLIENGIGGAVVMTISETADCVVDYALNAAGTTAAEALDFTYATGSITFTDGGSLSQAFDYAIIDDADVEPTENIVFEITGVTGTCAIGFITQSTVIIIDNDVPPIVGEVAFAAIASTIDEDNVTFTGTISMTEASDCEVVVILNIAASTADVTEDFEFVATVLTFEEGGPTAQTFDLNIFEDALVEPDETVVLEIGSISGSCTLDETADVLEVVIVNEDFVGIDEFAANGIQLYTYDNAVFIYLNESNANLGSNFQMLDASGRVVFNATLNDAQNIFTLSNLPSGMYVARITTNGKSIDKQVYLNN